MCPVTVSSYRLPQACGNRASFPPPPPRAQENLECPLLYLVSLQTSEPWGSHCCFLVWAQGVSAPSLLGPDTSAVGLPCAPVGWSAAALACIRWMLAASPSRAGQECLQTSPDGGTESPSSGQKTGIVLSEPPQGPKHMTGGVPEASSSFRKGAVLKY